MMILFWIIIVVENISWIVDIIKVIVAKKRMILSSKFKIQAVKRELLPKIIIVIPCLREQKIIEDTLAYFFKITRKYENVKLVVVTTERETYEMRNQNKNEPTTNEIVKKYIFSNKMSKKITLMHYPKVDGIMADQLNFVLQKYQDKKYDNAYFCVYNADSRPHTDTIENVIEAIIKNKEPEVIQQYSYAFSNLEKIPFIMKGFALYQSNFEIKKGFVNALLSSDMFYTYVVGHGMYIRIDILKSLNGFNNKFWCEDIYLSSNLRNKNIKIVPTMTLENMESPKKISILMKQNANWFKTSSQVTKIVKTNYSKYNKISSSLFLWSANRFCMNASWLLLPIAVAYTIIYSIISDSKSLLIISIATYIIMQLIIYINTLEIIEKIEKKQIKKKITLLASILVSTLISNIGPLYSLLNIKMKKYKTER